MNENFNNDGMGQSGNSGNVMPPKPNNNLIFAIFTTICCCLPLGIYAIILANKVNTYYMTNQYELAVATANDEMVLDRSYHFCGMQFSLFRHFWFWLSCVYP